MHMLPSNPVLCACGCPLSCTTPPVQRLPIQLHGAHCSRHAAASAGTAAARSGKAGAALGQGNPANCPAHRYGYAYPLRCLTTSGPGGNARGGAGKRPFGFISPRAHHAAAGSHWLVTPYLHNRKESACPLSLHQLTSSAILCSQCTVRQGVACTCTPARLRRRVRCCRASRSRRARGHHPRCGALARRLWLSWRPLPMP